MLFAQAFSDWLVEQLGMFVLMMAALFALIPTNTIKGAARFGFTELLKSLFGK